jgi:trigger factor
MEKGNRRAMKTSVDAVSGVERKITVEIPADEVDRRIEQEFTELRRMVPVRGFRKGKAPMEMVKRMFRDSVEAEVSEHLVKESLTEVVKEKDLKVLSMPGVEGAKVVPGKDFVFSATVEVVPEVDPVGYKGIPVTREKVSVTDDDVSAAVERLRESFAQFHPVEGHGAAASDLVEFGFTAVAGGETVDRSDATGVVLAGGMPYGEEFERRMLGVEPGTARSFEVAYPADFRNPKYAGRTVTFEVQVTGVRVKKLPEMDDSFAKQFGDVSGVDELKTKVRERLVAEGEEHSRHQAEEALRKALAERNPFDVPATLVKRQTFAMMQDTLQRLASQGVDLKKMNMNVDKMSERFAPNAERMVRVGLLIDAIARKENIEASFSEIDAEMKAMAEAQGMEYGKVREMYSSEERMDALRDRLLERKVLDFMMKNAEVTEGAPE